MMRCDVHIEAAMFSVMLQCLSWYDEIFNEATMSTLSLNGVSKRPRNDEHIITPNYNFELYEQLTTEKNIQN